MSMEARLESRVGSLPGDGFVPGPSEDNHTAHRIAIKLGRLQEGVVLRQDHIVDFVRRHLAAGTEPGKAPNQASSSGIRYFVDQPLPGIAKWNVGYRCRVAQAGQLDGAANIGLDVAPVRHADPGGRGERLVEHLPQGRCRDRHEPRLPIEHAT